MPTLRNIIKIMGKLVKSMPMSRIYDGSEPKITSELYKSYSRVYWLFVKDSLWSKEKDLITDSFESAAQNWNASFRTLKKRKPKTLYRVCVVPDDWRRGPDFWLFDAAYTVEISQISIVAQPNWTSDHPLNKSLIYQLELKESERENLLEDQIMSFLFYCYSHPRNI